MGKNLEISLLSQLMSNYRVILMLVPHRQLHSQKNKNRIVVVQTPGAVITSQIHISRRIIQDQAIEVMTGVEGRTGTVASVAPGIIEARVSATHGVIVGQASVAPGIIEAQVSAHGEDAVVVIHSVIEGLVTGLIRTKDQCQITGMTC
jgi:hypothetical protein